MVRVANDDGCLFEARLLWIVRKVSTCDGLGSEHPIFAIFLYVIPLSPSTPPTLGAIHPQTQVSDLKKYGLVSIPEASHVHEERRLFARMYQNVVRIHFCHCPVSILARSQLEGAMQHAEHPVQGDADVPAGGWAGDGGKEAPED